jgi:hypothetical protein
METATIKVFQITEIEWFAAATEEDALKAYAEYAEGCYGKDSEEAREQLAEFGGPEELSEESMQAMRFTDEDGTVRSFREELDRRIADGDEFPAFFATSEY